jgi:hypothetical protein
MVGKNCEMKKGCELMLHTDDLLVVVIIIIVINVAVLPQLQQPFVESSALPQPYVAKTWHICPFRLS